MENMKSSAWYLGLLAAACAYSQNSPATEVMGKQAVEFVSAFPAERAIRFDCPVEIDWHSLAPEHFEKLTAGELAELAKQQDMFHNVEKTYVVNRSSKLAGLHFYLIASEGIFELRVERMEGTVRLRFEPEAAEAIREDYGSLLGTAKNGALPKSIGFVAITRNAVKFQQSSAGIAPSAFRARMQAPPNPNALGTYPELWTMVKNYKLRLLPDGPAYYFIQFVPDGSCRELCCESRYLLTTPDPSLTQVASSDYDCDI